MKLVETGALLISRTGPLRNIKTQSLGTAGKKREAFNPISVLRIFSTVHQPLGLFHIDAKIRSVRSVAKDKGSIGETFIKII